MSNYLSIIVNINKNDQNGYIKLLNFTKENNMKFISFGDVSCVDDYISENNEEYSENMIMDTIKNKLLNKQNVTKQMLTKIYVMTNQLEDLCLDIEQNTNKSKNLQQDINYFAEKLQILEQFLIESEKN